jgi:hypothetical protein
LETKYQEAENYRDKQNYQVAYNILRALGDYKDSKSQLKTVMLLWQAQALGSGGTDATDAFCRTVTLSSDDYFGFYNTIALFVQGHPDADFWLDDYWDGTDATKNVASMLKKLPSSYQDVSTLTELFNVLTVYDPYPWRIFRNHEDLMRTCWDIEFIQDLATEDLAITFFLEGYWTGSGYYLNFYENKEGGGTHSEYDLPWISEPKGTKYYDIEDMIYYYEDANEKHLSKVYRFEIIDYDIIKVYCYKNNRTYTLYR